MREPDAVSTTCERPRMRVHLLNHDPDIVAKAAIVVPARNEEDLIAPCLDALGHQQEVSPSDYLIVLVANNCADETVNRAIAWASGRAQAICIAEVTFASDGNVGRARRVGCDLAAELSPATGTLLTTDADCQVDPDWVVQSLWHLERVPAVCGLVVPDPVALANFPAVVHEAGHLEYLYRQLVLEFQSLMHPDPLNPWPFHGRAAGASMGFRRQAYDAVNGFQPLSRNEDVDIIRRLKLEGFAVKFADSVRVTASCRFDGRAPGGMADALSARFADPDSYIDDALYPVAELIRRELAEPVELGPSMPVPRMRPSALPDEIARLEQIVRNLRHTPEAQRRFVPQQWIAAAAAPPANYPLSA